ncbi:MAG: membrane protein insertase YidC [Betaproteobacteria bacterium]|nr:membrane protein insertase YidC [Betaproteobacteria bacterium]
MDTQRLILFFVFVFSAFMLVDAYQSDQRAQHGPAIPEAKAKVEAKANGKTEPSAIPVPQAPAVPSAAGAPASPQAEAKVPSTALGAGGEIIKIETDLLRAQISTKGGDVRYIEFKQHKGTLDKTKPFVLFQNTADHVYVAQSGLIGEGMPNHHTLYTTTGNNFVMKEGADQLEVRLSAPEANGVKIDQVYRFTRGSYLIDVSFEITNASDKPLQTFGYYQLVRDRKAPDGDSMMLPTYTGPAVFTRLEKFQKVAFDDIDKGKKPYGTGLLEEGWVAMIQHYFMSAYLPSEKTQREFYTSKLESGLYAAGVKVVGTPIAAGQKGVLSAPLYAGPQDQKTLEKLAPGLELVVDYGILTIFAAPLFWVLQWIHGWVGNWGVAIILLTVLIKLVFYPLQEASYKAMARMKVIAPKMQQLKERYGDDRQRMQKAMMELYQKEKVNPMAGCLPILVQMPVFIALYWVILASVELRHAPFYGWIQDLSSIDPWYILPVLMGLSMVIQMRLNPVPPDPIQAKVMKIMPIAFSIFFFFFPAGLVLYWLVNNILSIAQQWHINRKIEGAAKKPAVERAEAKPSENKSG